jgi:hypothetical protein
MRIALLILVALLPAGVSGQTFYGGVRGAVRDATGVVVGVPVSLANESTSVVSDTVTNTAGEYVFANIPPGSYTLTAALSGFKTFERRGPDRRAAGAGLGRHPRGPLELLKARQCCLAAPPARRSRAFDCSWYGLQNQRSC